MSKLFVNTVWGSICFILLLAGIVFRPIFPISIFISLSIIWWRIRKFMKAKRIAESQIPQELLDDLNEAERRYIKGNGETEPHQILWEIARAKQKGLRESSADEPTTPGGYVPDATVKRADIQGYPYNRTSNDKVRDSRPKGNNRKVLFGRRIK